MQLLNIGDAAAAAGVTPKMIRHYEMLGLIPEPQRTDAGYRLYGEREVAMLQFIRQSRGLGFSMQQIESLLSLWRNPSRHSKEVKEVAQRQLEELQQRQRELDQMRGTLEKLVQECRGDDSAHCAILDRLSRPAKPCCNDGADRAKKALKAVRPGERRPAAARPRPDAAPAQNPHAALTAWSLALARHA
ncbi:Cu(I)-responsive transcriptional regulator [Ramlibacter sp. PS4R-6]|uniref:Cu(I)-responsive transcriptional regulator n=1 Tax=Ramlibacter sp. PS4R-6 TaxID=3133438 RepID=UPI0030A354DE